MKLTPHQKKIIKEMKEGWRIETDGVGAELVLNKTRKTLKYPTFTAMHQKGLLELHNVYKNVFDYEVYILADEN